jgi:MFS family permease
MDERRERQAVWLVALAHGVSHYYMFILVPLFAVFREQWGVSFVQLGIVLLVWNVFSVAAQTPMGFLVDRVGSRKLLIAALVVGALGFASAGVFASYSALIVAAIVGGLANSVYHPADYDILHHTVRPARIGRAFAIHSFVGYVGYALAPPLLPTLYHYFGLQAALIIGASVGLIPALLLAFAPALDHRREPAVVKGAPAAPAVGLRALLTPTIVGLTIFFTLITLASGGLQNFSIPALVQLDGIPYAMASWALTAFMTGNAIGVLLGGALADRTSRHEDVAFAGFFAQGLVLGAIGALHFSGVAIVVLFSVAGIFGGMLYPSRDMLVRKAAPPGAMGRTFGIVTTGFNLGGLVGPVGYGWLMDSGQPRLLFLVAAGMFVLTAIAPLITERRRKLDARTAAVAPAA